MRTLLPPLVLVLVLGCDASSSNTPADAAAAPDLIEDVGPFSDACAHLADSLVTWVAICWKGFGQVPDRHSSIASCAGWAALPGSQVTPADIEACADALASPHCNPPGGYPPCLHRDSLVLPAAKGTGAVGAPCVGPHQCATGICSASWGNCGRCLRPRDLGESCDQPDDTCIGHGSCNGQRVCVLPGKVEGERCFNHGTECQETLYCKAPQGGEGVCTRLEPLGAACDKFISESCQRGLYCRQGLCAKLLPDGAQCAPPADRCEHYCVRGMCTARAAELPWNADCSQGDCAAGLTCERDVCVPTPDPYIARGGDCGNGKELYCAAGLYCPNGTCVDRPAAGQPCSNFLLCAYDSTCRDSDIPHMNPGTCRRKQGVGAPCPCFDELVCKDGVCVAWGAELCR